jgi:hypothetical protein
MNIEAIRNTVSQTEVQKAQEVLRRKRANNIALSEKMDNPVRLFYPAGGYDISHLTMPSVNVMAIVDVVPFLFASDTRQNNYSSTIHSILREQSGRYIPLADFFTNPSFLPGQQVGLVTSMHEALKVQFDDEVNEKGFQRSMITDKSQVTNDNFANVLAGLSLMDVDFDTIQIGKFEDDFRLQFMLDGMRKTAVFRNEKIDYTFSDIRSLKFDSINRLFDGFDEGVTVLIVKADAALTAEHTVEAVNPDFICGSGASMNKIRFRFSKNYAFPEINETYDLPYPSARWGYDTAGDIQIAERVQTAGWHGLLRSFRRFI